MKITIITVVYNGENTLEETIVSVLSQTYKNIEYIIIDGGSVDGTRDIIEKYRKRITKIISEPDEGIYDAMNKGIKYATGDIIGILNADDLYGDNRVVEDISKYFEEDRQLDILYSDLIYVNAINTDKVVRKWKSSAYHNNYFETGNVPPHPTLFLRSHVYKDAGNFNLQFKLAADYEFMLRIFKKNKFKSKYIERLTIKMRLGGATNKNITNIINGNKEILKAWKQNELKAPVLLMPIRIYKRLIQFF